MDPGCEDEGSLQDAHHEHAPKALSVERCVIVGPECDVYAFIDGGQHCVLGRVQQQLAELYATHKLQREYHGLTRSIELMPCMEDFVRERGGVADDFVFALGGRGQGTSDRCTLWRSS